MNTINLILIIIVISSITSFCCTKIILRKFNVDELNNAMKDMHRVLSQLKKRYKKNSTKRYGTPPKRVKIEGKKVEVHSNPNFKSGK